MDFKKLVEYQKLIRKNLKEEQQTDKKIELLSIINQMTYGVKNLVQKEQVVIEALSRGFSYKEIEKYLDLLIDEKIIFEPTQGYIKKR